MTREPEELSRYFDGEVPLAALPDELKEEARKFDRVVSVLKAERVTLPPAVREQVMEEVRLLARSPFRRGVEWVTTPRTLRLSPLTAGLALAAALALMIVTRSQFAPPSGLGPTATTAAGAVARFVFVAPTTRSVAVTGNFVNWDPDGIPMEDRRGTGVWIAEVDLTPGVHEYVFIVDGTEWRPDPNATSQVDDGFGQKNSVLLVPARS